MSGKGEIYRKDLKLYDGSFRNSMLHGNGKLLIPKITHQTSRLDFTSEKDEDWKDCYEYEGPFVNNNF